MQLVNAVTKQQIDNIKQLYFEAFPKNERKPFNLLLQKREDGAVDILSIEDSGGTFYGLAIVARDSNLVLLDYFALNKSSRGGGIGSEIFQKLKTHYRQQKFIIEIENPEIKCDNQTERIRRKNFYLKNGMEPMPFIVNLFGIEMEILTNSKHIRYEEYLSIYKNVFGEDIAKNIQLKR